VQTSALPAVWTVWASLDAITLIVQLQPTSSRLFGPALAALLTEARSDLRRLRRRDAVDAGDALVVGYLAPEVRAAARARLGERRAELQAQLARSAGRVAGELLDV
jgi:hypothetical protein